MCDWEVSIELLGSDSLFPENARLVRPNEEKNILKTKCFRSSGLIFLLSVIYCVCISGCLHKYNEGSVGRPVERKDL